MRPRLVVTLLLFALVCAALSQEVASARPSDRPVPKPFDGAKTFQYHCAACHGADARGHGPAAIALEHHLPDLTLIAQRNGGSFPYRHVKEFITGIDSASLAQSDREMPIWGPIFHQVEADQDWGEVRLDAITRYVESIQQK